jgi:hypothetical protein
MVDELAFLSSFMSPFNDFEFLSNFFNLYVASVISSFYVMIHVMGHSINVWSMKIQHSCIFFCLVVACLSYKSSMWLTMNVVGCPSISYLY